MRFGASAGVCGGRGVDACLQWLVHACGVHDGYGRLPGRLAVAAKPQAAGCGVGPGMRIGLGLLSNPWPAQYVSGPAACSLADARFVFRPCCVPASCSKRSQLDNLQAEANG
eukprot:351669-Chlamydomonas_euryale.AAC.8